MDALAALAGVDWLDDIDLGCGHQPLFGAEETLSEDVGGGSGGL
jgi:hypothetical protein